MLLISELLTQGILFDPKNGNFPIPERERSASPGCSLGRARRGRCETLGYGQTPEETLKGRDKDCNSRHFEVGAGAGLFHPFRVFEKRRAVDDPGWRQGLVGLVHGLPWAGESVPFSHGSGQTPWPFILNELRRKPFVFADLV